MRQLIYRAMHQSDDLVVTFEYCDAKGCHHSPSRQPDPVPGQGPLSRPVPQPRRTPAVLPGSLPERAAGAGGGFPDAGGDVRVKFSSSSCDEDGNLVG